MRFVQTYRGATLEAIVYPILLVILLWGIFLMDRYYHLELYKLGLKPSSSEGLKGIVLMPFIHGQKDFSHIINNSVPTLVLMSTLIYFYRSIAHYVLLFIWLGTGLLLWLLVGESNSYHIGISGVIYGLFGFLFMSGFLRRYLPLQAISLFVVFVYGSLVWGIFPGEPGISWQGHFLGLMVGVVVAIAFRKQGPQRPKYQYEIEKEMGIPPPDFEGEWLRKVEELQERQKNREEVSREKDFKIIYDYKKRGNNEEKS
jgi:membrane associated rhomboid family serine protease